MARASKAAGSPGKCASCGKGLPKSMKSAMTRCPHCGKALKTDSSAIKGGCRHGSSGRHCTFRRRLTRVRRRCGAPRW